MITPSDLHNMAVQADELTDRQDATEAVPVDALEHGERHPPQPRPDQFDIDEPRDGDAPQDDDEDT